jgi:hypothetical protein
MYLQVSGKFSALQDYEVCITQIDSVKWQLTAKYSTVKLFCRHSFFYSFNGGDGCPKMM